jgi:hypothetical protein
MALATNADKATDQVQWRSVYQAEKKLSQYHSQKNQQANNNSVERKFVD